MIEIHRMYINPYAFKSNLQCTTYDYPKSKLYTKFAYQISISKSSLSMKNLSHWWWPTHTHKLILNIQHLSTNHIWNSCKMRSSSYEPEMPIKYLIIYIYKLHTNNFRIFILMENLLWNLFKKKTYELNSTHI